jgi:phosphohistidine phosphatase
MRNLFLLRHAQAESVDGGGDRKRRLTATGLADALALGRAMKEKNLQPDFIFCSPALRTRETLSTLMQSLAESTAEFPEKLYSGTTGDIFHILQNANENAKNILVVGHNPAIHELAALLSGDDAATLLNRVAAGYKPGTLTAFACACDQWADLRPAENTLQYFLEPLDYNAPATPARWT